MSYPLVFRDTGTVVAWGGTGTFYESLIAAIKPAGVTYQVQGDAQETTGDENNWTGLPGLKTITGTVSGLAFATPRLGNGLAVTFSSGGYTKWLSGFTLDLALGAGPHEITEAGATPPEWTSWMPDYITGTGTFDVKVDSDTALAELPAPTATVPTLTLTYGQDTVDNTIAGSAILTGRNVTTQRGQPQTVQYSFRFTGAITPAGTNSIFGSSAFDVPLWDQGGANDTGMTITHASGRTIAGEAFWTRIRLEAALRTPLAISIDFQGTGAWTVA